MQTLPLLKCAKCGHSWVPRVAVTKRCPNCFSRNWDKPLFILKELDAERESEASA